MQPKSLIGVIFAILWLTAVVRGSDGTIEKIRQVWKEEGERSEPFAAEGAGVFEIIEGPKVTKTESNVRIFSFPHSGVIEYTGESVSSETSGFNDFYSFRLGKKDSHWMLLEIGLKGRPEYSKPIHDICLMTKARLLPSVFDTDKLADVSDCFDFKSESKDVIVCHINREFSSILGAQKATYLDGEVHLLKENPAVVKKFVANAIINNKRVKLTRSFNHEMHAGKYRVISRVYIDEFPEIPGGFQMTWRDQFTYNQSPPDEQVTRLSHYGLPEPNGVQWDSNRRPWLVWGVSGAFGIVAAIFLYLAMVHRSREPVPSK